MRLLFFYIGECKYSCHPTGGLTDRMGYAILCVIIQDTKRESG